VLNTFELMLPALIASGVGIYIIDLADGLNTGVALVELLFSGIIYVVTCFLVYIAIFSIPLYQKRNEVIFFWSLMVKLKLKKNKH